MPRATSTAAQSRNRAFIMSFNHTFTLADVRLLAADPAMLEAASAWAKVHHPATALARAA